MKTVAEIISENRRKKQMSQITLAEQLRQIGFNLTHKAVSKWETGLSEPSIPVFMEICRLLEIPDLYEEYFGENPYNPAASFNEDGKKRLQEYAFLLTASGLFNKPTAKVIPFERSIPLYAEPASAGPGNYLTGEDFEEITVGDEVPADADFGIRVSGNSMEPRFIDGQIVFVRRQETIENGEIGVFLLDNQAYIKKLHSDSTGLFLLSLNKDYAPIPVPAHSTFSIFGKVVG